MTLSPGSWLIIGLALLSSILVALRPSQKPAGMQLWLFNKGHDEVYQPPIKRWNAAHAGDALDVTSSVLSMQALERRLLSGYLSDTPVPDLVEVEATSSAKFFSGPADAIGFLDITQRLRAEGLDQTLNPPSLRLWQTRGRTYGIPHDVHPVLLAYRADIVEAAGIDVTQIETWDDFTRLMRPLMTDVNRDGRPDRYLLNVWETNVDIMDILVLQAGGLYIDEAGRPAVASEINARVLATMVHWTAGPGRIGINAKPFSAEGNYLYLNGQVLATLMPDWMAGVWMQDLPGLSGKVKLMPLPAWEPGGRRTSVQGGTMLSISKRCKDPDAAWEFAKSIYLNAEAARVHYRKSGIIPPSKALWSDPAYDEPNPYFSGQANGRLFIQAAPDVPARIPSPFKPIATQRMIDALQRLKRYAEQHDIYEPARLQAQALAELRVAEAELAQKMTLNRFLEEEPAPVPAPEAGPTTLTQTAAGDVRPPSDNSVARP
jgi:arabinosaccharide transport system substrate-binding protein